LPISTLDSGDTEVSQPILVRVRRQSAQCLSPDEKGSQLILDDFKEMAVVLPDELVLGRHPIADSPKWTAPRHAKFLLQLDVLEGRRTPSLRAN
jgi:hypothetical protein